jgi:hypothetical protein
VWVYAPKLAALAIRELRLGLSAVSFVHAGSRILAGAGNAKPKGGRSCRNAAASFDV